MEARVDKGVGPVATVIVRDGTFLDRLPDDVPFRVADLGVQAWERSAVHARLIDYHSKGRLERVERGVYVKRRHPPSAA